MRTITFPVYHYDELSEEAKKRAREKIMDSQANHGKLEELMGGTEVFLTYKYGVEGVDCSYSVLSGPKIACYVAELALEKILRAQNKVGLWKSYQDLRNIGLPELIFGITGTGRVETRVNTRTEKKAPTMAVLKYAQILEAQLCAALEVWHTEETEKLRKETLEYIPTHEEAEQQIVKTHEYSYTGERFYPMILRDFISSPL